MCNKYIGFGSCSKSYKYILFAIILRALQDNFFSFTSVSPEKKIKIFFTPVLSNHVLIQNFYKYIGCIIGGLIFKSILNKRIKIKENIKEDKKINPEENFSDIIAEKNILLYYGNNDINFPLLEILIISCIYAIHNELLDILYSFNIVNLYFWTIHIFFIIFFMKRYFVTQFYNFQKCSFIFMLTSVSILLLTSAILPVGSSKDKNPTALDIIESMTDSKYYIILFIIIINLLSFTMSYARVKVKVLTDYKYITPYIIIIVIGFIGIICTIIELTISSLYKCKNNITDYCLAKSLNNSTFYFDNINIYFDEMKERHINNKTYFYVEIIIFLPLFLIINFFELVCEFWIIISLNPIFVLIQNNFSYAINNLIYLISNINNNYEEYLPLKQFFISESAEIIAIICYLIYLQIIELKFCGLDKYLKKNMIKISNLENSIVSNYDSDVNEEDENNTQKSDYSNSSVY